VALISCCYKLESGTVRRVRPDDKKRVLRFCNNTFSWGDYIDTVWDSWLEEGEFFTYGIYGDAQSRAASSQADDPVGICHAHMHKRQVWIEGIRVHPDYRRRGIAAVLVKTAEDSARNLHGMAVSRMLIDTVNSPSLSMARLLGYTISQTWIYHHLNPGASMATRGNGATDPRIQMSTDEELDPEFYSYYVKSWRWYETGHVVPSDLLGGGMGAVVVASASTDSNKNDGDVAGASTAYEGILKDTVAIMTVSRSIGGTGTTLSATLYPGSDDAVCRVLAYLQEQAATHGCSSINVFSKTPLPAYDTLKPRFTFHLVEKSLVAQEEVEPNAVHPSR